MERAMRAAQPGKAVAPRLRMAAIRAALALVVKYGGSLLWAAMVFLLAGVVLPRLTRTHVAASAAVIAILVELSRLVHTPWLDAFRLTTAGALLLGRIFSPWNMVAYGAGILVGVWLDRVVEMQGERSEIRLSGD